MTEPALPDPLPLFPLGTVLFPDALLSLRIFEARYLDLMAHCLRERTPFGVICIRQGREVGRDRIDCENVGTLATLDEVDADEPGILKVRCTGGARFRLADTPRQQDDGLWVARAEVLPPDPLRLPGPAMLQTVQALAGAIKALAAQGRVPFARPYRLDDAGWVANRWCELLPVPLSAKQKLMELDDPVIRLSLVDGFLRDKKVVID